ncbi:glycosyltransferase family 4 protein [Ferrimicrobium sp.]|uniref:glycosyltransferase family 4 protein n=1 Tax=Ferrimicrobium sp. TaxID=2926050 RepID=UPI00260E1009|nr:glycosyltransferase family 4 protein [Ferrimicrobium sp.]
MTQPLRIGFVGTELAPLRPSAGGLERLVTGWAAGLRGHDSILLSRFDDGTNTTEHSRLPLAEAVASYDVVVINNRPEWTHQIDKPTVLILHNTAEAWRQGGTGSQTLAPLPLSVPSHVTIATVSLFLAHHAQEELGLSTPPRVLPPFVDPAFLGGEPWNGSDGRLLFPNRLLVKKGVHETIDAVERLADPRSMAVFLANFAPWTEPTVEHLALVVRIKGSTRCSLEPRIDASSNLATRMAAASAVLAPSTRPEGLGLVPLESLALGIPTIISGLGGLRELAPYGATITDPADIDAFASAIETVLTRPPQIDSRGIRRDFSLAHSVGILAELIDEVIQQ